MRALLAVALGALWAAGIACGAAKQPMTAAPPSSSMAGATEPGARDARAQIETLDAEIRAELGRMGLPAPTSSSATCGPECAQRMAPQISPPSADATCKPGASDTCRDSCKLADTICGNASKICDLAAQMSDDAWANGKCVDGKTSCDNAKQRCCACL